ncbi:MAG: hypothetical protein PF795_09025 [Kiritimatiellae bacterium]|jgi:hypothetical protein|nr:hypothetical protein [Kiritimatiellia bacterium]
MTKLSIYIGGLLSLIGLISWTATGFESPTALIPAFIGAPIALFGWLTDKQPARRKIYMHIAVGLAIVGFLASASRIPTLEDFGDIKSVSIWTTCILCFILVGAFVQSFLKARTAKEG